MRHRIIIPLMILSFSAGGNTSASTQSCESAVYGGKHSDIKIAASRKIDYNGKSLDFWITQLRDKSPIKRREAVRVLRRIGPPAGKAVPALQRGLKDENAKYRVLVVRALGSIGTVAVPALIKGLSNNVDDVRSDAAYALAGIGPEAARAVPDLIRLLKDQNPQVRSCAAIALGSIRVKGSIPSLIKSLEDKDSEVRACAAGALGEFGSSAKNAVLGLTSRLKDMENEVRCAAVIALGRIGPDAKNCVPHIRPLSGDKNVILRIYALTSLWRIAKDPNTILELGQLLANKSEDARFRAALALRSIGPPAKVVLPALRNASKDSSFIVAGTAASAIERIQQKKIGGRN